MKKWPLLFFSALSLTVRPIETRAQPTTYTVANTHSHNDYEQPTPFWMAWQERFGSIEADIWLVNGLVLVGHDREEIKAGRTLEQYYIKPLQACVHRNNGYPYADTTRKLQVLIDVKEDSVNALAALIALLDQYPALEHSPAIRWVISGNRPAPEYYTRYPAFIAFDGVLHARYTPEALSRIAMMSDDLHYYTHWDAQTGIPDTAMAALQAAVQRAHALHLPVRFWDAPDFPAAWSTLRSLRVDYINTDHIRELAAWLRENP
jgi:alkaline phosphatase